MLFVGANWGKALPVSHDRISTHDQHTLAMQMDAIHKFATRRGWTVIDTVEEIASGAQDSRPKRQALLEAAKQRKLDVILVWKLDRWGRSLIDLMTTLQELTTLGVGFVSLTEALDLTTPAGRAFAGFLAVFAEFERDLIRERIQAGITAARKRGKLRVLSTFLPLFCRIQRLLMAQITRRKASFVHRNGPNLDSIAGVRRLQAQYPAAAAAPGREATRDTVVLAAPCYCQRFAACSRQCVTSWGHGRATPGRGSTGCARRH
jgi:putative DNA-invertase from lambdoid prophage Rac